MLGSASLLEETHIARGKTLNYAGHNPAYDNTEKKTNPAPTINLCLL